MNSIDNTVASLREMFNSLSEGKEKDQFSCMLLNKNCMLLADAGEILCAVMFVNDNISLMTEREIQLLKEADAMMRECVKGMVKRVCEASGVDFEEAWREITAKCAEKAGMH